MTDLAYCRGCGEKIHREAPACPQCGAPQTAALPSAALATGNPALAIVSCVVGIVALLAVGMDDSEMDRDTLVGGYLFVSVALVCGCFSLHYRTRGFAAAVVGLVTAGISLLLLLGSS